MAATVARDEQNVEILKEITAEDQQNASETVKAKLSEDPVVRTIEETYGIHVRTVKQEIGYDNLNYRVTLSESWKNPHISAISRDGYLFKVREYSPFISKRVAAEAKIQRILALRGVCCPGLVLTPQGHTSAIRDIAHHGNQHNSNGINWLTTAVQSSSYLVQLQTFIPGKVLEEVSHNGALFYNSGQFLASIHAALQDCRAEGFQDLQTEWALDRALKVQEFIPYVRDPDRHQIIRDVLDAFRTQVLSKCHSFSAGLIHGDFNTRNIIVSEVTNNNEDSSTKGTGSDVTNNEDSSTKGTGSDVTNNEDSSTKGTGSDVTNNEDSSIKGTGSCEAPKSLDVCGVIDFEDAVWSRYVFDVAIAMAYMFVDARGVGSLLDPAHFLAGYLSRRALNDTELAALKVCVAARLAQSLVMGEYSYSRDPGNEYLLSTGRRGWGYLQELWDTPADRLYQLWSRVVREHGGQLGNHGDRENGGQLGNHGDMEHEGQLSNHGDRENGGQLGNHGDMEHGDQLSNHGDREHDGQLGNHGDRERDGQLGNHSEKKHGGQLGNHDDSLDV